MPRNRPPRGAGWLLWACGRAGADTERIGDGAAARSGRSAGAGSAGRTERTPAAQTRHAAQPSGRGRGVDHLASRHVTGSRRLSQALSEGDGISVLVHVADASAAAAAEEQGAEGLVLDGPTQGLREATALPILYRGDSPDAAREAGADA